MDETTAPYHAGERQVQARTGMEYAAAKLGQNMIRDRMDGARQEFFAAQPFLIAGAADPAGRPWASMLTGGPGFATAREPGVLGLRARTVPGDPLGDAIRGGAPMGLLGIEFESRRRNRLNGRIDHAGDGEIALRVQQSFGNCPKYIQARRPGPIGARAPGPVRRAPALDKDMRALIAGADTFFIASHYGEDESDPAHGVDASHRGGPPGFVRVADGRTLEWPDYAGNFMFNTLGNIAADPACGLLFVDFESGATLQLTGRAEIVWDEARAAAVQGAQRLVAFHLDEAVYIEKALPLAWEFLGASPHLARL